MRKEIIPIWLAAFIAFFAPFVVFIVFQIRRRSIDDFLTTTLGLLKSKFEICNLIYYLTNHSYRRFDHCRCLPSLHQVAHWRITSSLPCSLSTQGFTWSIERQWLRQYHV